MSKSYGECMDESFSLSCNGGDNMNSSQYREKKKDKLKQYLKQLKQIVETDRNLNELHIIVNGNRAGIKPTEVFHHVLGIWIGVSFRKEVVGRRSSTNESEMEFTNLPLKSQNELQILIKKRGFKIVKVSSNLKTILGFPVDSWPGRNFADFLHIRDTMAVQETYLPHCRDRFGSYVLNVEDETDSSLEKSKKIIYCRLRSYKSLHQGFNLNRMDKYIPFQALVSAPKTAKTKADSKMDNLNQCLLLECIPIKSAYKDWLDISAEKKTFTVRHDQFCVITSIDHNTIPLLGFLPQDIIGKYIFDLYHPEDFEQLNIIYQQVINAVGSTVSSPQIRIRTFNGEWIEVKSEWACFINPWSKLVEFIICQHTVVREPNNTDVFSFPVQSEQKTMHHGEECKKDHLRMLQNLLTEPVHREIDSEH